MKRNLILLTMLLAIVSGTAAQEIQPYLVAEGLQWARCNYAAQYIYTLTYELRGDTVIDGKTYKMEWCTRWEDLSHMEPTNRYMREENGKVYHKIANEEEFLWFDYDASIGDTIFYRDSFIKIIGYSDTTITCNGITQTYKGIDVQVGTYDIYIGDSDSSTHYDYYLFPGEMATFYEALGLLTYGDVFQTPEPMLAGITFLLWVKRDGTMLYQLEEGLFWQDNTSVTVPTQSNIHTPYYDLQGRPVAYPTRGIYIKDGKKIAVD